MNHLLKSIFVLSAFSVLMLFTLSVTATAQSRYDSDYQPLSPRKPVVEYYEKIDDKSFYQQKRIHGMKGELNNYSEKLHSLQDRFDKIFYGLSAKGNFKTPFDTSNQPKRPAIKPRTEQLPTYPTAQSVSNEAASVESQPSENKLAFNVNSPGTFTKDDQVVSTFNLKRREGLGYYFLINSGISFAHKRHDTTRAYKKYAPGFLTAIAGGFQINNFKIGMGGSYKSHSFADNSILKSSSISLNGKSETFSGHLDLGYNFPINQSLEGYFGVGLGYYLSFIEDKEDTSSRKDHGVYLTGSTGITWRMSELFALSLGYRYFHENEVPAHIAELGANFDF